MAKFKTLYGTEKEIYLPRYRVDWNKQVGSKFQFKVKDFFKLYWWNEAVYEEVTLAGNQLRLDLYNHTRRIAVESNGRQHIAKIHWNSNHGNFMHQIRKDVAKEAWCAKNDIKFLEIYERNLPLTEDWIEDMFGLDILN